MDLYFIFSFSAPESMQNMLSLRFGLQTKRTLIEVFKINSPLSKIGFSERNPAHTKMKGTRNSQYFEPALPGHIQESKRRNEKESNRAKFSWFPQIKLL